MSTLLVRNLPQSIVEKLKRRAAAHGRSAEAEHRAILREVLEPRPAPPLSRLLIDSPLAALDAEQLRAPDRGRDLDD